MGLFDGIDLGDWFGPALGAAAALGGTVFSSQHEQDLANQQRQQHEADMQAGFAHDKEMAQLQAALSPMLKFTKAQKVNAIDQQTQRSQEALNLLVNGYRQALSIPR